MHPLKEELKEARIQKFSHDESTKRVTWLVFILLSYFVPYETIITSLIIWKIYQWNIT